MNEKEMLLYAARDISTGKLVSNITSPSKKFWQRKDAAKEAIHKATSRQFKNYNSLELVTYKLVEVTDND